MGGYSNVAVRDAQGNIIGYQSTTTGQTSAGTGDINYANPITQQQSANFNAITTEYAASRNRVITPGGVSYQGEITKPNPYPTDSAAGIAYEVARTGGASDYQLNLIAEQQVRRVGGDPSFIRYATDIYAERPQFSQETLRAKSGATFVNEAWSGVPIRLNLTRSEMADRGVITEQNYGKRLQYNQETFMLNRLASKDVNIGVDTGVHKRVGDFGGPILQDDGSYGGWRRGGDRLVGGKTVAGKIEITTSGGIDNAYVEPWSILPQNKRIYLSPPEKGIDITKNPIGAIASMVYGIPYGLVKGAETVRAQEKYEFEGKSTIDEYTRAEEEYTKQKSELDAVLQTNKQYVSKDESGKYVISSDTPSNISELVKKEIFDVQLAASRAEELGIKVKQRDELSPMSLLQKETSDAFSGGRPIDIFGVKEATAAWKGGIESITSPILTPIRTFATSPSNGIVGSILRGVADFPVMTTQMIADAPLAIEMASRDVLTRGTEGISTMGGYGTSSFGQYIVKDPIRAGAMFATGIVVSAASSKVKSTAMESTGFTRKSTYEMRGEEVVPNAPATRTIGDILLNKMSVDVTHSSPSPIVRGFNLISRKVAGDVGHGTEAPGVFGAPIVKSASGKVLAEYTSQYLLNKPLLRPALKNLGGSVYEFGKASITSRDYSKAISSIKSSARGFAATAKRYTPVLGGSRTYLIKNVETMADIMSTTERPLAMEMIAQWKKTGMVEESLYNRYVELAYQKSASAGGKPIAIVAPKKAAGYHLGTKGAMGAPFESEIYMVAAKFDKSGKAIPLKRLDITSRKFSGFAYGPSSARVVELTLKGQTGTRKSLSSILRENRQYNKDTFKTAGIPTASLWKINIMGSSIQKGWYDAMVLDASLKAKEMFGGSSEWAPHGYYGKHGVEHSEAVAKNYIDILGKSPRTVEAIVGVGPNALQRAQAMASAMGLGHDIGKIGEAETQPYSHAFISSEGITRGDFKRLMGTQTYQKIYGTLTPEETISVSMGISEHTTIQPIRAPTGSDIINWNIKPTGGVKQKISNVFSHTKDIAEGSKTLLDPLRGVISKALWRPGIEGRTLATADRLDIGRVGRKVQSSKLFRTPEEQREANIQNAGLGLTLTASALMMKSGVPPVAAGFVFTRDFMNPPGKKKSIYSNANVNRPAIRYNNYLDSGNQKYYTNIETDYPPKYAKEYQKYAAGYSKYDPSYTLGYEYQRNYNYGKGYNKQYGSEYEKRYERYTQPYRTRAVVIYKKPYQKPYEKPYEKPYQQPYQKPYEKPYEKPYQQPYQKPYDEYKPPLPLGFGYAGGGVGGQGFAPRSIERWQRTNPVADIPYLSRGLSGPFAGKARATTAKRRKKSKR